MERQSKANEMLPWIEKGVGSHWTCSGQACPGCAVNGTCFHSAAQFQDELAAPPEERNMLSTFDIASPSLPPALSKRPSRGYRAAVLERSWVRKAHRNAVIYQYTGFQNRWITPHSLQNNNRKIKEAEFFNAVVLTIGLNARANVPKYRVQDFFFFFILNSITQ